ncbi:MAG TPA: CYTH domain-containing protein [Draconibacterium sp.]|nr:CYTH domain-containing protein [Draconibacterium sp.]
MVINLTPKPLKKQHKVMIEIERKFLVDKTKWSPKDSGTSIIQGYLSTDKERVVRVRIRADKAWLTIKGKPEGISRIEMEYEIPLSEAGILMELCLDYPLKKKRYLEKIGNLVWEIDVFEGCNQGLILAEVELSDENEEVDLPPWIEKEVSNDWRYYNSWLAEHPYTTW